MNSMRRQRERVEKIRQAAERTEDGIKAMTVKEHMDQAATYQAHGDVARAQLELTWALVKQGGHA